MVRSLLSESGTELLARNDGLAISIEQTVYSSLYYVYFWRFVKLGGDSTQVQSLAVRVSGHFVFHPQLSSPSREKKQQVWQQPETGLQREGID